MSPAPPARSAPTANYVNTQAIYLTSSPLILQHVADELSGRNLDFFRGTPQSRIDQLLARVLPTNPNLDPETILKDAIVAKKITANAIPRTQILALTMRSADTEEAKTIVNCFLRNYEVRSDHGSRDKRGRRISTFWTTNARNWARALRSSERPFAVWPSRWEPARRGPWKRWRLDVQATLMAELITLESQKIAAEADVNLIADTKKVDLSPEEKIAPAPRIREFGPDGERAVEEHRRRWNAS